MTEELLDETAYRRLTGTGQESIIARYCSEIEHRISIAPTADTAKMISELACKTFRKECASGLVGKALTDHVMGLYEKYWGKDSLLLHSTLGVGRSALPARTCPTEVALRTVRRATVQNYNEVRSGGDISFLGDKR